MPEFDSNIFISEVRKAVEMAYRHKASDFDSLPYEVLINDTAISFLHILFNVCYESGKTPTNWEKGAINPIPKPGTSDQRDPLNYCGITLALSMHKLYCSIFS